MGRTTLNITGDASCTVIVSNIINRKKNDNNTIVNTSDGHEF